jgi:inosine-uridine nucleoside N-ribohydrolase
MTFLKAIECFSTTICRERQYPGFVLCDQLAVFAALHPPVIRQAKLVYAKVELGGSLTRGQVVIDHGLAIELGFVTSRPPNIRIVTELHTDVVVQLVKRVINSPLID